MNVNLYVIEDYREKDDFAVQKNKPNTNPIKPNQSQNKPNMNPKDLSAQKKDLDLSPGPNSGGRIRTCDLRVMGPTSYQTALPRGHFSHFVFREAYLVVK